MVTTTLGSAELVAAAPMASIVPATKASPVAARRTYDRAPGSIAPALILIPPADATLYYSLSEGEVETLNGDIRARLASVLIWHAIYGFFSLRFRREAWRT